MTTEPAASLVRGDSTTYAERMWRACTGSPFAPATELLSAEDREDLRPAFMARACDHATRHAVEGGTADPWEMMYVVAQ